MSQFIYGSEITLKLEQLILEAEQYIWLIAPSIQLHDKLKAALQKKKEAYHVEITILFGKQPDITQCISQDDLAFLQSFPFVKICYEKNLHAQYYASENCSILSSLHLHQFAQNYNIEAGVLLQPNNALKQLVNQAISTNNAGEDAINYFRGVIANSEELFIKRPHFDNGILGFNKKYLGSNILKDHIAQFFSTTAVVNPQASEPFATSTVATPQVAVATNVFMQQPSTGYCIRTGVPIPFNPNRPYSDEAYASWAQFENWDYPEKYCHATGKPSFGKTSMRHPVLS